MRSLIQLAGRVRRHRSDPVASSNILVFSHNLRHFRQPGQAAFCQPGFETDDGAFHLSLHDLRALMAAEEIAVIDARPRIVSTAPSILCPRERLVDLEHARMLDTMLPQQQTAPSKPLGSRARAAAASVVAKPTLNASTWWRQAPRDAVLTAVLPQQQPFREEPFPRDVTLVLLPDEDEDNALLHRVVDERTRRTTLYEPNETRCEQRPNTAVQGNRIEPWGVTDYMAALSALAEELNLAPVTCAERFGRPCS